MQPSIYPIRWRLVINALCLAGLLGCQNAVSQRNDLSAGGSEPQAASNVAADDFSSDTGDAIICAFFGLDNALPIRANALVAGAYGKDGMPINFKDEIDSSTLDAKDFLVIDHDGGEHVPIAATLKPADENGENRTVLLIGEFGNDGTNPPVEVRIVGDLQTKAKHEHASAPSRAKNLKNTLSKNVIPLSDGPSMFFAQILGGDLAERKENNSQVVQVAWQGGITPIDTKVAEKDLFQFYTVHVEDDGKVTTLTPKSIADVNDNDNYHQLLVETHLKIVKVSMPAGIVKDPNGDPNPETQVLVER
jgi:hypothetical protein